MWTEAKDKLKEMFDEEESNYESEVFLNAIWELSTEILNEKEVSVIVDSNDNLFISKGTRSFVDYEDESVVGMRIPLKCWIHTHPFGAAYFSDTDWNTINTQLPILNSAIVIGDKERMKWWKSKEKQFLSKTNLMELDESEE
jgi:hypothetical protein|tara:strand:- start:311 stop:736 length:426 start_codon:yes stop_codon:yes gene_type:complete